MGKKLNEFQIEQAIAKNPMTQFETCCFCNGIDEGMVMHEVDYETFDVMCDESFEEYMDNFIRENIPDECMSSSRTQNLIRNRNLNINNSNSLKRLTAIAYTHC